MLVKPARAGGSEAAEARLDAFMEALDDVPHWAVAIAIRKWHRGECGLNEHGERYDYRWAPESADLRRLARIEAYGTHARIEFLERLLNAVAYRDCTAELAHGRAAYRGLLIVAGSQPDRLTGLTFDAAAEIGARQEEHRRKENQSGPPSSLLPPKEPSRDPIPPTRRERLSTDLAERKARNEARFTEPTAPPPQLAASTLSGSSPSEEKP